MDGGADLNSWLSLVSHALSHSMEILSYEVTISRRHAWLKNVNLIEWPLYLLRTSNYEFSEPFVDGGGGCEPPCS